MQRPWGHGEPLNFSSTQIPTYSRLYAPPGEARCQGTRPLRCGIRGSRGCPGTVVWSVEWKSCGDLTVLVWMAFSKHLSTFSFGTFGRGWSLLFGLRPSTKGTRRIKVARLWLGRQRPTPAPRGVCRLSPTGRTPRSPLVLFPSPCSEMASTHPHSLLHCEQVHE